MASTEDKSPTRRQFLKSAVLSGAGMATSGVGITTSAATASNKPLVLGKQGQSSYSILLSQDASPSERRAAAELQKFVEEMTGARLPIITDGTKATGDLVLVGDSRQVREARLGNPVAKPRGRGLCTANRGPTPHHRRRETARHDVRRLHVSWTSWAAAGSRLTSA